MRITVTALATCMALVGLSVADEVHASIKQHTDIPAQPLAPALQSLAKDRNFQIVYVSEEIGDRRTAGAVGEYTPEEALKQLLEGTGLTYKYLDDNTITIVVPTSTSTSSTASQAPRQEARGSSLGERFRLAQAAQGGSAQSSTVDRQGAPQGSQQEPVTLEEIIVTAQKREERLIDVPISIVAVSADELAKRNIKSLDDLYAAVPGLSAQNNGGFVRRITLRGISNTTGNSSLVGLYLDEASVTSSAGTQLDIRAYDLERVEVLRGPQGTLYGEGSVGGTVRFITKNPVLDRFAAQADVAALFTEDGAPGQRVEGVLNVPLIDDELGVRIAGTYDHAGGWIDQPAAGRENYNGQDLKEARVKGLWLPTSDLTVSAMAVIHRNNGASNNGEDANGNYTQVFNLTTAPQVVDNYDLYNLTLSYDLDAVRILSTTSYIKQDMDVIDNGSALPILHAAPPLYAQYIPLETQNRKITTEELRLTSIGSGPWRWTLGGFYRNFRYDDAEPAIFLGVEGPVGTPLSQPIGIASSIRSKSFAAFGDSSYRLTDRLTLGAGLRYFHDDQELYNGGLQQGDFHALNPRAYLQYKLTEDINTYASASKGFRSGGFNTVKRPSYGPETVWTYELGTKASLLSHTLSVDAALFYSDYTNYQITGQLPPPALPLSFTRNAGDARIKGAEVAILWRALPGWELGFNGDYLQSRFYKVDVIAAPHIVGDPLDMVPRYQLTASLQRDFSVYDKAGFARLDYNQQGAEEFRSRNIGPWYYSESDVINMLNLNVGLQWSSALSVNLFAQNLLDDRGRLDATSIAGSASRARPRTYGIEFGVNF